MRLTCPNCRRLIDAPDTPGLKIACGACGQKIMLPEPPKPAAQNRTVLAAPEDMLPTPPAPSQPIPVSVVTAPRPTDGDQLRKLLVVGGLLLTVVLIVVTVLLLTRTPSYSVAELVKAYHPGMKGQRVRVTGPVFLTAPDRQGVGTHVELYEPAAQQYRVGNLNGIHLQRPLLREEVVTLVGTVHDRFDLRPFLDHSGTRVIQNGSFVSLANVTVE